ncbi:MAG: glycosyltransferase family 2 protein [Candidatus Omnitrophica bacterium]|nr:glycosyltransferase family 2 protein [Candidatus Omnitrophota bacterium]
MKKLFDSIVHNGFEKYEIIFVDDFSGDQSVEIARQYKSLIIHNKENKGPAYCRNKGAQIAKGEVLLFCDSDITIDKGSLSKINQHFVQDKIDAMIGCPTYPPLHDNWVGNYRTIEIRSCLRTGNLKEESLRLWSSTLGAIRKDLFLDLGGFNEEYKGPDIEDFELYLRFPKEAKVIVDEDVMYHHLYKSHLDVIVKAFRRSFFLGNLRFGQKGNVYLDDKHRKISIVFALFIWLTVGVSLKIPMLSYSIIFCLFLKIYHDRLMLQKSFRLKGLFFVVYTFLFSCLMAIPVLFGFLSGKSFKIICPKS